MNPRLDLLQPYAFERLRKLLAGVKPPAGKSVINLQIGEPQHPPPQLVKDALAGAMSSLAKYPVAKGLPELRESLSRWMSRRYGVAVDPETEILPVSGTREALFSIAQAVLDPGEADALVVCPNPFYQIYEGATLLAGARPYYVNLLPSHGFRAEWHNVPESVWKRTRMVFTCSPNNPNGRVMPLAEWKQVFDLADRHGFVVVSDECYSEIYFDESAPPLGALAASRALGREGHANLVVMGSLSKRSNVPGMRSGFAAGSRAIMERFALYRTYHGAAVSNAVQIASIAAWEDEEHVVENRRLYREKFAAFYDRVHPVLPLTRPEAAFYYWVAVPGGDDEAWTRDLFAATGVTVLPGSYLSRDAHGLNPGRGFARLALVSTVEESVEAAARIAQFAECRRSSTSSIA
jgi:N-succinyldiaminopimelate aminotransferase